MRVDRTRQKARVSVRRSRMVPKNGDARAHMSHLYRYSVKYLCIRYSTYACTYACVLALLLKEALDLVRMTPRPKSL